MYVIVTLARGKTLIGERSYPTIEKAQARIAEMSEGWEDTKTAMRLLAKGGDTIARLASEAFNEAGQPEWFVFELVPVAAPPSKSAELPKLDASSADWTLPQ